MFLHICKLKSIVGTCPSIFPPCFILLNRPSDLNQTWGMITPGSKDAVFLLSSPPIPKYLSPPNLFLVVVKQKVAAKTQNAYHFSGMCHLFFINTLVATSAYIRFIFCALYIVSIRMIFYFHSVERGGSVRKRLKP